MSMDKCTDCGAIVDTDDDCNFYDFDYTTKKKYGGHCESCRDDIYDQMTEAQQAEHEKRIYG
jgi:hypothetical protein